MKIEVVSKVSGLNGGPEVWVRVLSNEMHDWPTVQRMLDLDQLAMLVALGANRRLSYFPHNPGADEREAHGYTFEDWFVSAASVERKATA